MPLWYPLSSARSTEERRSVSRPQESCEHDANIDAQYEQGLQCSESVVAGNGCPNAMMAMMAMMAMIAMMAMMARSSFGHRTVATHPLAL